MEFRKTGLDAPWNSDGQDVIIPIGVQKDWTEYPFEFRRTGLNAHWSSEGLDLIPIGVQKDWAGYPIGVQKDWTCYSLEFRRIGRHTHSLPACLRDLDAQAPLWMHSYKRALATLWMHSYKRAVATVDAQAPTALTTRSNGRLGIHNSYCSSVAGPPRLLVQNTHGATRVLYWDNLF